VVYSSSLASFGKVTYMNSRYFEKSGRLLNSKKNKAWEEHYRASKNVMTMLVAQDRRYLVMRNWVPSSTRSNSTSSIKVLISFRPQPLRLLPSS